MLVLNHIIDQLLYNVLEWQGNVVPAHIVELVVEQMSILKIFETLQILVRSYVIKMYFLF